jgi:prepilin-type processing-associated H-X9-DG protein
MSAVAALLEGCVLCNDSHLHQETLQDGRQVWVPNGAPTEVSARLSTALTLSANMWFVDLHVTGECSAYWCVTGHFVAAGSDQWGPGKQLFWFSGL